MREYHAERAADSRSTGLLFPMSPHGPVGVKAWHDPLAAVRAARNGCEPCC